MGFRLEFGAGRQRPEPRRREHFEGAGVVAGGGDEVAVRFEIRDAKAGEAGLALARARFAKETTAAHLREVLTSSGKVNGPPASLPLAAAHLRQFLRGFSTPLRSPASGKSAVFP